MKKLTALLLALTLALALFAPATTMAAEEQPATTAAEEKDFSPAEKSYIQEKSLALMAWYGVKTTARLSNTGLIIIKGDVIDVMGKVIPIEVVENYDNLHGMRSLLYAMEAFERSASSKRFEFNTYTGGGIHLPSNAAVGYVDGVRRKLLNILSGEFQTITTNNGWMAIFNGKMAVIFPLDVRAVTYVKPEDESSLFCMFKDVGDIANTAGKTCAIGVNEDSLVNLLLRQMGPQWPYQDAYFRFPDYKSFATEVANGLLKRQQEPAPSKGRPTK